MAKTRMVDYFKLKDEITKSMDCDLETAGCKALEALTGPSAQKETNERQAREYKVRADMGMHFVAKMDRLVELIDVNP
jgi:hypothetical protein